MFNYKIKHICSKTFKLQKKKKVKEAAGVLSSDLAEHMQV
jgi:hypothetical protein